MQTPEQSRAMTSAILCNHANEVPSTCVCEPNCYCKENTCKKALNN